MASEIPSVQLPMGLVKIGDNAFRTSRIESESGTRYTQTDKAEITGNMTFNRYTYEMRAVIFHMEHVTTDGETAFKLSEDGSEDYICTLTPEKDYLLTKSDITVEVGGETLAPADYIYNAE